MQLSKSLLQAIAVSVTLGTAAASCTKTEISEEKKHECTVQCSEEGCKEKQENLTHDCAACGMG